MHPEGSKSLTCSGHQVTQTPPLPSAPCPSLQRVHRLSLPFLKVKYSTYSNSTSGAVLVLLMILFIASTAFFHFPFNCFTGLEACELAQESQRVLRESMFTGANNQLFCPLISSHPALLEVFSVYSAITQKS